jgi:hypothetical protein
MLLKIIPLRDSFNATIKTIPESALIIYPGTDRSIPGLSHFRIKKQ